jgi:hypothetical protein
MMMQFKNVLFYPDTLSITKQWPISILRYQDKQLHQVNYATES